MLGLWRRIRSVRPPAWMAVLFTSADAALKILDQVERGELRAIQTPEWDRPCLVHGLPGAKNAQQKFQTAAAPGSRDAAAALSLRAKLPWRFAL